MRALVSFTKFLNGFQCIFKLFLYDMKGKNLDFSAN